jgi:hypothetical protein
MRACAAATLTPGLSRPMAPARKYAPRGGLLNGAPTQPAGTHTSTSV